MAGASIQYTWDDVQAQALLRRLLDAGANLLPLYNEIGSDLEDTTRQRFRTETGPDGVPWLEISKPWADAKKEKGFSAGILKMRGDLLNSVRYEAGSDFLELIAGPTEYAAIHQGGGQAGRGRLVTIPARPYMGISDEDGAGIVDAGENFLERAIRG